MNFEKIKLTDIIPAEYNPRKISEADSLKLRNSIDTFGVVDPIIINLKNNHIIGGHQRYDALLNKYMEDNSFFEDLHLLKLGDIGWAFPDTDLTIESEDHEKALNLALNKISGEWDNIKLEEILNDLEISELDIELSGFDDLEKFSISAENDILFDEDSTLDDGFLSPSKESEENYIITIQSETLEKHNQIREILDNENIVYKVL